MKLKGIAAIVGVAAVILVVVFLPTQQGGVPPSIQDDTQVKDSGMVGIETGSEPTLLIDNASLAIEMDRDAPVLSDTILIEPESSMNFYLDENGTKHYVIDIVDKPTTGS